MSKPGKQTKRAKSAASAQPVPVSPSEKRGGKKGSGRTRAGTPGVLLDARAQELPAAAVWLAPSALKPWKDNPKRATKAEIRGVADSMIAFGFGAPFVAREEDLEIIAGHTRLPAVLLLPKLWEKADPKAQATWSADAARIAQGGAVPVRLLPLSVEKAHLLALADNELGADWQGDMLKEQLALLSAEERLLAGFIDKAPLPVGDDTVPQLPKKAKSKLGQRYELGPHVLVCGDSRDASIWHMLLAGQLLGCFWNDPPYGVEIVGGYHAISPAQRKAKGGKSIQNDALSPEQLREFLDNVFALALLACNPGASWYIAAPAIGPLFAAFGNALLKIGVWRHSLIWLKDSFVLGRADYHYRHEPIFYGWEPSGPHYWAGARNLDSVLEFPRPKASPEHPTMKPPELIQVCIENSSKLNDLVGDPFGGSGSTLIAAARTGRRARLIELDPLYCDVIRKRWGDFARTAGVEPGSGAL